MKNNFIFIRPVELEEFMNEYSDLFDSLSALEQFEKAMETYKPKDNELQVIQWLVQNMIGIKKEIKDSHNPAYHLFPDPYFHIYLENYENNVIAIIKKHIQQSEIKLNPEEINCIITKDWLTMLFG